MAVNGINSNNSGMNDLYNSIFGYSSYGSDSVGGGSFNLSDYYMIKNGTYKKLMNAYYAKEKTSSDDDSTDSTSEKKTSQAMVNMKSNSASLNNSLQDLKSSSLYESSIGEDGKTVYKNKDKAVSAVKSFVESYNALMDSDDVDNSTIERRVSTMMQATSKNSALLKKIGVSIGENGKLTIDEDKLNEAKVTDISSLFTGSGSYGDQIQKAARQTYQTANSQIYSNTHASSYTYQGNYALAGYTNGVLDKYL